MTRTVAIDYVEGLAAETGHVGEFHNGMVEPFRACIKVEAGLPPADATNVLLHEVLHAVWWAMGLRSAPLRKCDRSQREEAVVEALTDGLCKVMQDSPELFKWLLENNR